MTGWLLIETPLTTGPRGRMRCYLLFTVSGFLFGSLPGIHAQLNHLWSLELAYGVSNKPKIVRFGIESIV